MLNLTKASILLLFQLFLIFSTSCTQKDFECRSGDLLFQVNESNSFTDAITSTTGNRRKYSFSHVAVISVEDGQESVIEALPRLGVRRTSLHDFLNSSAHNASGKPLVVVYRLKKHVHAVNPSAVAEKYIGLPYDTTFMPGNCALYCSELVYESYLNQHGRPVFTAKPMSFKDSTGQISPLWINYFKKTGKPVPEGMPGTNPNDLSKEKIIREVYRYF